MSLKQKPFLTKALALPVLAAFGAIVGAADAAISAPAPTLHRLTLGWNASTESDVQNYRVLVGTESGTYTQTHDAGVEPMLSVPDLVEGQTYYFAVRAVASSGVESANSQELVVTVLPQPVAVADSHVTTLGEPLIVPAPGVLANDTDMDSAVLTAILDNGPQHGSLTLNPDGGFTYTPAAGYVGTDSFSYHASDGELISEPVAVSIVIHPENVQLLVNGSFESDFAGWSASGHQAIAGETPYAATDGSRLVAFNAANEAPDAMLSQTFPTIPGATYVLDFDAGVLAYNSSAQQLRVEATGSGTLLSQTVLFNGRGAPPCVWEHRSWSFVADSPSTTLTFRDLSSASDSIDLLLDNVSVAGPPISETVLPPVEPGSSLSEVPTLAGSPGNFTIGIQAGRPGTYVLERSENLADWEVVETREIAEAGLLEFRDLREESSGEGPKPRVFYRIGLEISGSSD